MARGSEIIVAADRAVTWGTAVSVNATTNGLLCIDPPDIVERPDMLPDESAGFPHLQYIDSGNRMVDVTLNVYLRWAAKAQWEMICGVIGDDAITGAGPYVHTMDVQAEPQAIFTLCMYDGVTVREIPSFKVIGVSLIGEAGDFWRAEIRGIGNKVLLSSQTNTTLGSVTYSSKEKRIPFGSTQVRINDQSAASLGALMVVTPSSLQIDFDLDMDKEFVARAAAEGSSEWESLEPQRNGHTKLEMTMGFNEFSASTYREDLVDETLKKMDMTITGPAISGGNNSLVVSFPAVRVTNVENGGSGAERIPETLTLQGLQAQSAPNGMSGITDLLRLVLTDDVSTAYDV